VIVAVWLEENDPVVAAKLTDFDFDATVTDEGTCSNEDELLSAMRTPLFGALVLKAAVQVAEASGARVVGEQLSELIWPAAKAREDPARRNTMRQAMPAAVRSVAAQRGNCWLRCDVAAGIALPPS
jgi:hypothetical protein